MERYATSLNQSKALIEFTQNISHIRDDTTNCVLNFVMSYMTSFILYYQLNNIANTCECSFFFTRIIHHLDLDSCNAHNSTTFYYTLCVLNINIVRDFNTTFFVETITLLLFCLKMDQWFVAFALIILGHWKEEGIDVEGDVMVVFSIV